MRKPKQLTLEQRYQIYILRKAGHNQTQTARHLGVRKSTTSRELRRNLGHRGYRPKQAQGLADGRRNRSPNCIFLNKHGFAWSNCSEKTGVPSR